ncbi:RNA polymerase sigma factor [Ilumatobacter sp.]|uniref:RNA polymerase sigma factor n=1 Tax=Ilumatobacter sp. TaxID=1967498 RepID=UPI003AF839A4
MHDGAVAERVRAVYESEHPRLWRSLYGFSGSREIADEAAAEAFAQVLRRGDEVRDVSAWVWRSGFAIARGELQRRSRERSSSPDTTSAMSSSTHDVGGADASLGAVLDRLQRLSVEDRELLVLCHVGGWRPGELAGVLDVAAGTVRVRLHRATSRARALLDEEGAGS